MVARWQTKHSDNVKVIVFSPDNALVATASAKEVALLDRSSGRLLRKFTKHDNSVNAVAIAPDSQRVASAGDGNQFAVLVWDATTLSVLLTLKGHGNYVGGLAWSPDGRMVASASADKTVMLWNAANGAVLFTLNGHTSPVVCVAFSANSQLLVSGSGDKTARVWNVSSGQALAKLECASQVYFAAFDGTGSRIITASYNKFVRMWDARTWHELRQFETKNAKNVARAAVSADGTRIATVDSQEPASIRLTDLESGKEIAVIADNLKALYTVAFSADGRDIAAGGADVTASTWALPVAALPTAKPALPTQPPDVLLFKQWTVDDVCAYLLSMHVEPDAVAVIRKQRVKGGALAELSNEDLKEYGLETGGDRKDVLRAIKQLTESSVPIWLQHDDIVLCGEIASGTSGTVFRGTYKNAAVAVKRPTKIDDDVKKDFVAEANLMRSIAPHPNVVQYFGICIEKELLLVLELCDYGSLQDYLCKHPATSIITQVHLGADVAAGMSHLSTTMVHRDLATRNILLAPGPPPHLLKAKIADFGLARPSLIYATLTDERGYFRRPLPQGWTPNEVLLERKPHTPASDVYMFATTLWEMFMATSIELSGDGKHLKLNPTPDRTKVPPLPLPLRCPDPMYQLMTECWAAEPSLRPTFKTIHARLLAIETALSATQQ